MGEFSDDPAGNFQQHRISEMLDYIQIGIQG